MPNRKTQFSSKLQEKHPSFKKGENEYETECFTCDTFVSVAIKGSYDLADGIDIKNASEGKSHLAK